MEQQKKLKPALFLSTHYGFINAVFKPNPPLKALMKCTWHYSPDTIVWMIRFNELKNDYSNKLLDDGSILEQYFGHERERIDHGNVSYPYCYRLAVEVTDCVNSRQRKYKIIGLYKINWEKTQPYKLFLDKIPDNIAAEMIPEAFE